MFWKQILLRVLRNTQEDRPWVCAVVKVVIEKLFGKLSVRLLIGWVKFLTRNQDFVFIAEWFPSLKHV